jgi:hypothetical protein
MWSQGWQFFCSEPHPHTVVNQVVVDSAAVRCRYLDFVAAGTSNYGSSVKNDTLRQSECIRQACLQFEMTSQVTVEADTSNSSSTSNSSRVAFPQRKGLGPSATQSSSISSICDLQFAIASGTAEKASSATSSQPKPTPGLYRESSSRPPMDRRPPHASPIMDRSRTDNTQQQALDTLHQIERRRANQLHLISPSISASQVPSLAPSIASILIQELLNKFAVLQAEGVQTTQEQSSGQIDQQHLTVQQLPDVEPASPASPASFVGKPWIVETKRFKKLNYRYGSAELYDDSESIEAIRARESAARAGGYVLNMYREYDWEGNALNSKLEICSMPLLEVIREVIDYYPGPEFDLLRWEDSVGDTVTFSEPYMMLFTHRSRLNASLERSDIQQETKDHVRLLLQFLREEMPGTSAKLDEIEAGTCKKISFRHLWLLYPPNTPVYIAVNGEDRQMVVYSRNVPEKNVKGQWGVLSLYCWSAKYEGAHLNRDFYPWVIQPFLGEKALGHLDLVPMQYLPKQEAVRSRLIARGNRYFELNYGPALQDYHGNKFPRVFKDVSQTKQQ